MSAPLLTTKLHIPQHHLDLVSRPLLIERLNTGLVGRLTLVVAPAGFGKTTLVTDWVSNTLPESYHRRVAWLSLDSADNTPVQFWTYLVAALQQVAPSIGKALQTSLHTPTSQPPVETVLISLINEIAQQEQPLILGLDDYHEIATPEIHQGLEFLIEHLPSNFHLVIVSREDVPFSISRYRVSGQLTEIRAADLRFSEAESVAFFNDMLSLALSEADVEALTVRTEGWIAGLQLAALSLRSTDDKSGFIQAFAGSHRFLTDYLVDEVLSRQTAATQKFLWRTSLLERFCAEICDALIDESDSRQILHQLEQANLFIIPLDNQQRWFRYHHLFAEFLRMRLYENEAAIISELYQRVIDWFEQADLLREALQYALQAEAYERAADLIETLAPEILEQDNHMLVIQWCETLPSELRVQRPLVCAYLGGAYVAAGQIETAGQWFDTAEGNFAQLRTEDSDTLRGYICAHRTYILIMQGDYSLGIECAQQALPLLPPSETALRARTVSYLGAAYNYCGRLQAAKNAYWEGISIAKKNESIPLAHLSYCGLGETLREEGHLTEALDAYRQFLKFAEELTGQVEPPLTGNAIFEIGVIYRERYDLDAALEQVQKGVALCREWQQGVELAIGLLELAEIYRLRGEYVDASATIQNVRQLVVEISPWAAGIAEGIAARLSLSRGDLAAVIRWAEDSGLTDEACELGYERFPECPALIRMYTQAGEPHKALALTEKLIARDRGVGRMGRVLDMLVLQFAALDEMGASDRALQVLADSIEIASPEKHLRPFVDERHRLVPYLQQLPVTPIRDRLLEIFDEPVKSELSVTQAKTALVEPLNEREIAILRLMSVGRTNREIGDELYLSVNTIRWYASQIYTKLGVKNRSAAVAQARELGLIA